MILFVANILVHSNKLKDAAHHLKRAIKTNQKSSEPFILLASIYLKMSQPERSKKLLEETLPLFPKSGEMICLLIESYLALKDLPFC